MRRMIVSLLVALVVAGAASTHASTLAPLDGKATDVGLGANGVLWAIGTEVVPGGFTIHRWNGTAWDKIPGGAIRIAVDPQGAAWVVNDAKTIFRWNGTTWDGVPGDAIDVGIGADGTVWTLSGAGVPQRFANGSWTAIDGRGSAIAVGPKGGPWVVGTNSAVFRYDLTTRAWVQLPGTAKDVAVAADGTAYKIGSPGGKLFRLDGAQWTVVDETAGGERITAGPAETFVIARAGTSVPALMRAGTIAAAPAGTLSLPSTTVAVPPTTATVTLPSTTVAPVAATPPVITPPPSAGVKTPTDVTWNALPGNVTDMGVGANGALWAIGGNKVPGGQQILRWTGSAWEVVPGGAVRIAVDPSGNPWVINDARTIFRRKGSDWEVVPGAATDVGIGADGTVWVLGGGGTPYRWTGTEWKPISGAGAFIAVGPTGEPWVVNAGNAIFHYTMPNGPWQQLPGAGRDIAVSADGTAYTVGMGSGTGPATIYRWQGGAWVEESVAGERVAAGPAGTVVVTKAGTPLVAGKLAAAAVAVAVNVPVITAPAATTTQIQVTQPGNAIVVDPKAPPPSSPSVGQTGPELTVQGGLPVNIPEPTPVPGGQPPAGQRIWNPSVPTTMPGHMVCMEDAYSTRCGTVEPLDLGTYRVAVPTDCPEGTYWDAIFGGTCWKCEDERTKTRMDRTTETVDSPEACVKEVLYKATRDPDKKVAFAWDCPAQRVWDGYDGGGCYHCGNGNRTGYPVNGEQACSELVHAPATFVKNVGCTEHDAWKPGKPRPYPDVTKKKCYACPTIDKDTGDVLISKKTADSGDNCAVKVRWKPTQVLGKRITAYDRPGQLQGAGELVRGLLADPDRITAYLKFRAEGSNTPAAEIPAFLEQQWADIVANPNEHPVIKAMLFERVLQALASPASERPPAEKAMLASFTEYAQAKREAIPGDALSMYYAWKQGIDQLASTRKVNMSDYFNYGTVPLDFDTAAQAITAGSSLALGTAGVTASWAVYAVNTSQYVVKFGEEAVQTSRTTAGGVTYATKITQAKTYVNKLAKSLQAVRDLIRGGSKADDLIKAGEVIGAGVRAAAAGGESSAEAVKLASSMGVTGARGAITSVSAVSAGVAIITIVEGIILDIAIDQMIAIESAEPTLRAKLDDAKNNPVSLDSMVASDTGPAQLALLWSSMLDGQFGPDVDLVGAATKAAAAAKASGYGAHAVAAAPPSPSSGITISGMTNPELASIAAIDRAQGTVTARSRSGGLITVVVTDPAAFPALRVGGGIWLDRQSQRASLDGKTACCKISKEGALDR